MLERSLRSRVGACSRLRSCDRGGDSDFAPKAPRDRVGRLEIAKWREKRLEILLHFVNESKLHLLEGLSPPPPPGPRIEIGDWRLEMEIGDLTESGLR